MLLLAGCGGSPGGLAQAPSLAAADPPAVQKTRSEPPPGTRILAGNGWTIAVPHGWTQESTEPPFEAQLVAPGRGEGRFTLHTVDLQSDVSTFIESSIKGAVSSGARVLARRPLAIGSAEGMVVEYVTKPRDSTLLGMGRVMAVPGQALAVVCSSTSARYVTAKDTCESVLSSIRLGNTPRKEAQGARLITDEGHAWSVEVPAGWRQIEHEPPMVALAVSNDAARDSISLSVLAAPVQCSADEGLELAHAYLSDEVAQGSFRVLERRQVDVAGRDGLEFDFFKERSSLAVRVAQVYLVQGNQGLVLSCGTAEDAPGSVRDDCNTMFTSLRFADSVEPVREASTAHQRRH